MHPCYPDYPTVRDGEGAAEKLRSVGAVLRRRRSCTPRSHAPSLSRPNQRSSRISHSHTQAVCPSPHACMCARSTDAHVCTHTHARVCWCVRACACVRVCVCRRERCGGALPSGLTSVATLHRLMRGRGMRAHLGHSRTFPHYVRSAAFASVRVAICTADQHAAGQAMYAPAHRLAILSEKCRSKRHVTPPVRGGRGPSGR